MNQSLRNYAPVNYQNPHATSGLKLAIQLISNTPEEELERNVRLNSRKYKNWLQVKSQHDTSAIMIGGGGSINDHVDDIKELQKAGATVFALNAASKWARNNGIIPDVQVIIDAKEETATLVDDKTPVHLFASRCNPETLSKPNNPIIFHLEDGNVESLLPTERVEQGGYVLIGGDTAVGTCALCVAFTQGYRDFHVFGYDSSHKDGKSHAYKQRMNNNMPVMEVEHNGIVYLSSIAMSKQPDSFMLYTGALKKEGCTFSVYGDGLLQSIYNDKLSNPDRRE